LRCEGVVCEGLLWVGVVWLGVEELGGGELWVGSEGVVAVGVETVCVGTLVHCTDATRFAGAPVTLASHVSPVPDRVWPVVSVTVTMTWAEAGSRDPPRPTVKPAASTRLMSSFVLFIRAAVSPSHRRRTPGDP